MRPLVPCLAIALALAGCSTVPDVTRAAPFALPPQPGEPAAMRPLIDAAADENGVPRSLVHRVIQRESDYRAGARNGPYYGLMQILPETARTMGHRGPPEALLTARTNLRYAVRYLRGAWILSGGDGAGAVRRYASGYYYEARDRCLLVETGLRDREVRRDCP